MRLDQELAQRGLARSRNHAASLIADGRVLVDGEPARKSAQPVSDASKLLILPAQDFVSRAGHKLAQALEEFAEIETIGKIALDIGASTGGFSDVLLRRGVSKVIAIDVGHDQLVPELRENRNLLSLEGVNARELSREALGQLVTSAAKPGFDAAVVDQISLVVADLSFISLTLVLEALTQTAPNANFVLLIKPQFEVGRESLHASGVVNDWRLRARAISQVVSEASRLGLNVAGLTRSVLPGTHGNIEYILWISARAPWNGSELEERIVQLAKEPK